MLVAQVFAPVSILLWPLLLAATQALVMTFSQGLSPFFPIGMAFLLVLSLPNILAAWIGSVIARRIKNVR